MSWFGPALGWSGWRCVLCRARGRAAGLGCLQLLRGGLGRLQVWGICCSSGEVWGVYCCSGEAWGACSCFGVLAAVWRGLGCWLLRRGDWELGPGWRRGSAAAVQHGEDGDGLEGGSYNEKKSNEKLETLIRSFLSKELLRRKTRSVPSASVTVGSGVKCRLVQRAPGKPELMALVLCRALR